MPTPMKDTEAIASYRNALSQRPHYAEAHNNIGNALRALGQHQEAIAHYRQALAIDPSTTQNGWRRTCKYMSQKPSHVTRPKAITTAVNPSLL